MIERGATVTFTQGVYNFKSFTIGNNATALFDVPLDKTIEINIETSLEFLDRATAKFAATGYAPCVKIYTNDYSVRIGTEVNLNGILTAPNAAVTICSRTHIEGAVYAKSITIEPNAVLVSNCVDPNEDDDGDGVPNLIEMVIGDASNDGEDYTLMGVPSPAMIDNTQDQTVLYNFGCKYPYFQGTGAIPITYPAGSLTNASIAPAYTMVNNPPAGIPKILMSGYKPVGNYMSMIANSLKSGQKIRVALPLYSNAQPMVSYTIAWYNADSSRWEVTSATPLESGALLSDNPISDVSAMIIVQSESRMIAYLGNGMTYSNDAQAKLRFNGQIDVMESENPGADPGNITISYLEHTVANPTGVPDTLTCPITNNLGILLISYDYDFTSKITVTGIQISSPNFFPVFSLTENFVIDNGQTLTFEINRTLGEMINEEYKGDRISTFYDVNAMTFESMGFSEGVIKNHLSSWGYHYYLRDHLGSTRMVVTDGDELAGAYMYQPYGTIDEVVTAAVDQVREKFTGKEFDKEGGVNAYHFGARVYDPEIGVWMSVDKAAQFWNSYGYPTNPIIYVDPDGNFALTGAIVAAIVGAAIGTVQGIINAHNQNGNAWDYVRETIFWSNVHGAIGFASGGVGGGIASNIKSAVGGIGGAIAAGAASGAVSGAMTYTGNYVAEYAYNGFDESYLDAGQYFGGLGKSVLIGGVAGGILGGVTDLISGTESGNVVYEPGSEGDGVIGDLRSGIKDPAVSGGGHSSHMKMVYSEGGTTKSLSWGGVRNNFNDVKIGSNAKTFVATGLKTSRITDVGNSLKNTKYNFVTHNCGQNVVKSVLGFKLPLASPTANYYALLMRQGYMSILGY